MFLIENRIFKDDFQYFNIGQKSVFLMSGPLDHSKSIIFFARNLSYAFIFHKNVVITCRSLSEGMFLAKNRQKYRFLVEITLKNFHLDPKTCQNSFLDLIYP